MKKATMSVEKRMQLWMALHGELPKGKHAKGDIHRRYKKVRKEHRGCDCPKSIKT